MSAVRDMRRAFALLTVLPVGYRSDDRPSSRVAAWFPWVGFVLGGVVLLGLVLVNAASVAFGDGAFLSRAALPVSVLVVASWAALSRLLHWDGLADVADAWWGGHTPERRLEIMADSSVGAFGATTVALVAIAQVAAVAVLLGQTGFGIALLAAPVFGRMSATFGAWLGVPARPGGLGAGVMGRPGVGEIMIASLALAVAAASMGAEHGTVGLAWSAFAFVVAAAVPHFMAGRFGGVTGDVLGASVILTETVVLLSAALVVSW